MSTRVETNCKVKVYEVDDDEAMVSSGEEDLSIVVHTHWNRDEHVVLEVAGKRWTVLADDLTLAIKRCSR